MLSELERGISLYEQMRALLPYTIPKMYVVYTIFADIRVPSTHRHVLPLKHALLFSSTCSSHHTFASPLKDCRLKASWWCCCFLWWAIFERECGGRTIAKNVLPVRIAYLTP